MRILILSQYYAPEPEAIPTELAQGLVRRGHEVTVFTGFPNYPYGKIYEGYRLRLWRKEKADGVNVFRFPLYPDRSRSPIGRSMYYLSLALSMTLLGPMLCGPIDIIFVYHPITLTIPALWISFLRRKPFVINIQDMYPESLWATRIVDNHFIITLIDVFAKFMYHRASKIIVISAGFKRNLLGKGIPEYKIDIILNWADENVYYPIKKDEDLANCYGLNGHFNIVYAGNMGPPQGLFSVIDVAALVSDIPEVQFIFIGEGLDRQALQNYGRQKKLSNVRFLPRHPASTMPLFFANADALLVHLIDEPLFEITIPSKIQSYLACGRPILIAMKGDAVNLVEKAQAGIRAYPSDVRDIARAVRALYSMSQNAREQMGANGRRYFLENLTMQIVIKKYETIFQNLITS